MLISGNILEFSIAVAVWETDAKKWNLIMDCLTPFSPEDYLWK